MPTGSETVSLDRPRRRGVALLVFAGVLGLAAADSARPAEHQILARTAIAAIDAYRAVVSPILARSRLISCRFQPTCSAYSREAIRRYGFPKGVLLSAGRILRCNPFSAGGNDPVP